MIKTDFKSKKATKEAAALYMWIKFIFKPSHRYNGYYNRVPKCLKQILTELKGKMDKSTITVRDFNPYFP